MLKEIEPVLTPENFTRKHVAGRTKDRGLNRLLGIGFITGLYGGRPGLRKPRGIQAAFGQQLRQHLAVGDVTLAQPHGGQNSAAYFHGCRAAVPQFNRNDQPRSIITGHRKIGGLEMEGHLQMLRKTLQLHQPVGLALRRALTQRQAAGDRENLAQIHGQHADRRARSLGKLRETCVPQIGPWALWRKVVVNESTQVCLRKICFWAQPMDVPRSICSTLAQLRFVHGIAIFCRGQDLTKLVLITGGSRGIGAATALLAARHGYAVAVNYSANSLAADEVVRLIRAAGGQSMAVQADVAQEGQVRTMFEKIDAKYGPLSALVNNAGIVDQATRVDGITLARLQRMFEVNVFGSFLCARQAVQRMSTRYGGAGGSIVNVSSAASRLGSPGQYVDYAAAKGAIDTFTLGLAKEVAAEGIRVNAVRPGIVDTDIHASGGLPNRARDVAPQVPMQRPGTAQEVAQSIVWLLGDSASYTTGALLDVAGGR